MPDIPLSYGQARKGVTRAMAEQSARVQTLARDLVGPVYNGIRAGKPTAQAVADAMEAAGVEIRLRSIVSRGLVQGLCMGAGIWPQVSALPGKTRKTFEAEALSLRWRPGEMDLSTRIHGTTQAWRGELVKTIEAAQNARDTTWRAARKIYDGYGFGGIIHRDQLPELPRALDDLITQARGSLEPAAVAGMMRDIKAMKAYAAGLKTAPLRAAYTQLLDKIEKGNAKGFERAVKTATEEKARYHAERIQRTEFARAWGEGVVTRMEDDPDVVAVRVVLSSAHKICDVCDFHAKTDHFGLGPGVYPLSRRPPFPFHPHCFCLLEPVYRGEVPEPAGFNPDGGRRFLLSLRQIDRNKLLTIEGSKRFARGVDWQSELRNWKGLDPHPSKEARDLLKKCQDAARDDLHRPEIVKASEIYGFHVWQPGEPVGDEILSPQYPQEEARARALQKRLLEAGVPAKPYLLLRLWRRNNVQGEAISDSLAFAAATQGEPFVHIKDGAAQLIRFKLGAAVIFDRDTGIAFNIIHRKTASDQWTPLN